MLDIHRHQLGLQSRDFIMPYVANHLNVKEACMTWMDASYDHTRIHIFQFPLLFDHSDYVKYFRTINLESIRAASDAAFARGNLFVRVSSIAGLAQMDLMQRTYDEMMRVFVMNIRRESALEDALDKIWRTRKEELRRPLKIRLGAEQGEEGDDLGGVQQEFFALAFEKALDPDYGRLFS